MTSPNSVLSSQSLRYLSCERLALLGAGEVSTGLIKALNSFHTFDIGEIRVFTSRISKTVHEGYEVNHIDAIRAYRPNVVILAYNSVNYKSDYQHIASICQPARILDAKRLFSFFPHMRLWPLLSISSPLSANDISMISRIKSRLNSPSSIESYSQFVQWASSHGASKAPSPCGYPQYVDPMIVPAGKIESFIDCGAFTGDTIRSVLDRYSPTLKEYYAFEPDTNSYNKLIRTIQSFEKNSAVAFSAVNMAISSDNCESIYTTEDSAQYSKAIDDLACKTVQTIAATKTISIDSFFIEQLAFDKTSIAKSFLKIDVEGYEKRLLDGGSEFLRRGPGVIALSIYHNPRDFIELPIRLLELIDPEDYIFECASYGNFAYDFVFYAIRVCR